MKHIAVGRAGEILFGAGVADAPLDHAGGHVEAGDQRLRAVAGILEFATLDLARAHRQGRRDPLQRLDAGHLIDRDRPHRVRVRIGLGGGAVDDADLSAFGLEVRIGLPREPQPEAMRLKVRLFFEKRPSERCEMRSTRPRISASRARSLWLHWLIGSPFCAGGSLAKAMIEQISSGVKVAGAPGRGASASRSPIAAPGPRVSQRWRQQLTVLRHTPSRCAVSQIPTHKGSTCRGASSKAGESRVALLHQPSSKGEVGNQADTCMRFAHRRRQF